MENVAKLTELHISEIKVLLLKAKLPILDIAKRYNVSKNTIYDIGNGERWSLFTGWDKGNKVPKRSQKGERHNLAKLTEQQVLTIRQRLEAGVTAKNVALEFDVDKDHIYKIKYRRCWTHI